LFLLHHLQERTLSVLLVIQAVISFNPVFIMVFGIINIVFVNIMALRVNEYGLMDIGSAEVIAQAGYVPVGTGLAAIGQIHVT